MAGTSGHSELLPEWWAQTRVDTLRLLRETADVFSHVAALYQQAAEQSDA